MEVNGIAHVMLTVSDFDACLPFYEQVLGFLGLTPVLKMDVLIAIHNRLPHTHLVMHGSSSVPKELQDVVNQYGGHLKQTWGVPVEEIQLYVLGPSGNRVHVTLRDLVEKTLGASVARADLHLGRSRDGEIFVTSRQDGMIRMLTGDSK